MRVGEDMKSEKISHQSLVLRWTTPVRYLDAEIIIQTFLANHFRQKAIVFGGYECLETYGLNAWILLDVKIQY